MPGIVVFRRRWSVGSDDFVVPAIFLLVMHSVWLVVVGVIFGYLSGGSKDSSSSSSTCCGALKDNLIGYLVLLSSCIVIEAAIGYVAMRGTILDPTPRASMQYLLYIRLVLLIAEVVYIFLGIKWLTKYYQQCEQNFGRNVILGLVICNCCVMVSVLITTYCTFDAAGRSWVKMKRYQRSMRDSNTRYHHRRASNANRNWRHRKVMRAYQDSWNQRCQFLFCCMNKSDTYQNSFGDIARLLSEFFRDLDVVPSDVVAGLVLLRKFQKQERKTYVKNATNDVYQFLSGVPVTPRTKFLQLSTPEGEKEFNAIVHYMRFALAVYGWLMYAVRAKNSTAAGCGLCPHLKCCDCIRPTTEDSPDIVKDNCCLCNTAALYKIAPSEDMDLIYATYHVDVGETPFFVALDHSRKAVVISIRGTLSMKDMITDLNAESDTLPLDEVKEDWLGHKGMVQAAVYIRSKLQEEQILEKAFAKDPKKGTDQYELVLVGHSLGAGAASILAILLRQHRSNVSCYAYSPPGGLLSKPVVDYSRSFITSVVVGKDVVPRIGLHQMETLRADLIAAIQSSDQPKWKTIAATIKCCGSSARPPGIESEFPLPPSGWCSSRMKKTHRDPASHPSDSTIALTVHQPLFPPGKILHVVRHHPDPAKNKFDKKWSVNRLKSRSPKPVYQAVWVDNEDFGEVLISPCMIEDHMPDTVLEALEMVLESPGPVKPQRKSSSSTVASVKESRANSVALDLQENLPQDESRLVLTTSQPVEGSQAPKIIHTPPHKLLVETSFTSSPVTSPNNQKPNVDIRALAHTLSWELVSALEEQILTSGIPKGYQLGYPDLFDMRWSGHAPLATPETMSDTSSISSRLSVLLRESIINRSPSPPDSPSANSRKSSRRYSRKKGSRRSNSSNTPRSLPLLTESPKVTPRHRVSAPLGQGYCFYIDAPEIEENTTCNSVRKSPVKSSPEEFRRYTPTSPQYITLSPIVPNSKIDRKETQEHIKDTLDELFKNIDKPPFVIDMDDGEPESQEDYSPTKSSYKGRSTDYLDCSSIEGFLDDEDGKLGSPRSTDSVHLGGLGQKTYRELSTSQMSKDSGYGERGASGRQSSGTLGSGTDGNKISMSDLGIGDVGYDSKVWGDAQTEYGRGLGPPHVPHYAYRGCSPDHSTFIHVEKDIEETIFPSSNLDEDSRISTNHPLHLATPLLHSLAPINKSTETSL